MYLYKYIWLYSLGPIELDPGIKKVDQDVSNIDQMVKIDFEKQFHIDLNVLMLVV